MFLSVPRLILLLALASAVSLAAVSAAAPAAVDQAQKDHEFRKRIAEVNAKTGARQISAADLQERLKRGERLVILDVREPEEMAVSALPGARPAPLDEVGTMPLNGIPADATVVTYCTVGYRSGKAAVALERRLGRPVYNLEGGIIEWFNRGGRVVDPSGKPVDRIDSWGEPWSSYVHPR